MADEIIDQKRREFLGRSAVVFSGVAAGTISYEERMKHLKDAGEARSREAGGEPVQLVPVVPDSPASFTESTPQLYREGHDYYRTPRAQHPNSPNRYVFSSLPLQMTFFPFEQLDTISPRPLLAIAGSKADTLFWSREVYEKAREPKELHVIEGATHIDLYDRPQFVTPAVAKLTEFFGRRLSEAPGIQVRPLAARRDGRTPMNRRGRSAFALMTVAVLGLTAAAGVADDKPAPLVIQEQGSFAVGGTVVTAPGTFDPIRHGAYSPADQNVAGQTLHGDHAYVFYQIPANPRRLPLVMWHGHGQSAKTWETTPDGREGFQNIFLRRRFPVYLVDQPRRGRASRGTVPMNLTAAPDEQLWFGIFRLGVWPNLFPGVQFAQKPEALEQFFRAMVPNTGPFDAELNVAAVSALFDKIGPGILITHSQSGGLGWRTAMKNRNVRAIVSYEPGSNFPFAEGETPAGYTGPAVPLADFMLLTKIPIVMYFGDNIPEAPVKEPGPDQWRRFLGVARLWRDAVSRRGGDVTLVHLPEKGVRGNTHFPMSDLNNVQIADLLSQYLADKKLD